MSGPLVHEQEYCEVPSSAVAVYPSIAAPPFEDGALHETLSVVLPGVANTLVGAPGTVRGVEEPEPEALDVPAAFVAVAVTVYAVPLVRSEIVHSRVPEVHEHVLVVEPSVAEMV